MPKCVSGADNSCQSAKQPVPFENAFRSSTCTIFPHHFTIFPYLNRRPGTYAFNNMQVTSSC